MAMFNSYVKLPEGNFYSYNVSCSIYFSNLHQLCDGATVAAGTPGGPFPSPSVTVISASTTAMPAGTNAIPVRQSQFERMVAEGLDPGGD